MGPRASKKKRRRISFLLIEFLKLNQLSSLLPSLIQAKSSSGNGPSSFFGYELIDILVEYFNLENRKDAISLGQSLLDNNIIIPKGFFTTK